MPNFNSIHELRNPDGQYIEMIGLTTFAPADFSNGSHYVGTEAQGQTSLTAVQNTNPALITPFDVRQFRQLIMIVRMGALTGGTSPSVEWHWEHLPPVASGSTAAQGGTFGLVPTAGGPVTVAVGSGLVTTATNGNYFTGSGSMAVNSFFSPFGRIRYFVAGGPTGLTAPNFVYLYGAR